MDETVKTVLLVEDELPVREYVRTILDRDGFAVIEAKDGVEGFARARELGCHMALMVTDIKMPRMDGLALAEKVRELYPEVPVLLISGYAYPFTQPDGDYTLLQKPFRPADLRHAVRNLMAA